MLENMNFQRIVLTIAGVLLLGFLAAVIYSMLKANTHGDWPPVISNCPDGWVMDSNGKTCKNTNNLKSATSCSGEVDFTAPKYLGQSGLCEKNKWSVACGVNWDGISNNPSACTFKIK